MPEFTASIYENKSLKPESRWRTVEPQVVLLMSRNFGGRCDLQSGSGRDGRSADLSG
jgi:hypothetical protein